MKAETQRKKVEQVLKKLEKKCDTLHWHNFSEKVECHFHGGLYMWTIRGGNHPNDKRRMFHTFELDEAVDFVLELLEAERQEEVS